MLIEILKPDFSFCDERGTLTQLVHDGFKQVNVIFSKKGVARGMHYHKENKEIFYIISGSVKLKVSKDTETEYEEYIFKADDMFLIPQFVKHSFFYEEDTLKVSMYNIGVEYGNGTKDIYLE